MTTGAQAPMSPLSSCAPDCDHSNVNVVLFIMQFWLNHDKRISKQLKGLYAPHMYSAYNINSYKKAEHLYSALTGIQTTLKRSGMDHTV